MLKRVPILTGGSERRGPAPLPPPVLPEVRAPPPAASEALEAPTRSIRIALLRAALSVPLFCARSRSGALRLSTRSPGRPRGPAAHVRILAALALLRSLGGWLRLSLSPHPRRETNSTRLVEGRVFSREVFVQCLARGKHSANVSCCYLKSRKLRLRG